MRPHPALLTHPCPILTSLLPYAQDHYDFGMRALKSVLVMAGSLKRANPEYVEDLVLIRCGRV